MKIFTSTLCYDLIHNLTIFEAGCQLEAGQLALKSVHPIYDYDLLTRLKAERSAGALAESEDDDR